MFINNTSVADPIISTLNLLPESQVSDFIQAICATNNPVSLGFVNQHAYNLMERDKQVFNAFSQLTYRLRDGGGIKIACKLNQCDSGANLNGTDLIPMLCDQYLAKHPDADVFVLGTQEPWLSEGAKTLLKGKLSYRLDGFADEQAYVDLVMNNSTIDQPRLIILAMGMPKQEHIAQKLMQKLTGPTLIVCGGAIIDFSAGRVSRAPQLFRRLGLEWLYRLMLEPKRLFGRYILGIPLFFYFILKNRFKFH